MWPGQSQAWALGSDQAVLLVSPFARCNFITAIADKLSDRVVPPPGKKKLLQKQAAGKKKMQEIGRVNVPSDSWQI